MEPGAIIVASDELSRFSAFGWSMLNLDQPEGSQVRWFMGADVTRNLNNGIRSTLEDDSLQWCWFIGDDHAFDSDVLVRLLAHDVEAVAPLCCRRRAPFHPVVYESENDDGTVNTLDLNARELAPDDGLLEVYAVGGAGLLLRRSLLERMTDPWWEHSGVAMLDEDLYLCKKLRELDVPIHVDLSTTIGHLTTMAVWPRFREDSGEWGPGLRPNSGVTRFDERTDPRGRYATDGE